MGKKSVKSPSPLSWDRLEGEWKQQRGKAVHRWGRMMNDELAAIAGRYEQLVGKLQERYGIANEKSRRQADEFKSILGQLKQSTAKLVTLQRRARLAKARPVAARKAGALRKPRHPAKKNPGRR
jgi:uncharacterized protein YjbJ (UPF0337 family)